MDADGIDAQGRCGAEEPVVGTILIGEAGDTFPGILVADGLTGGAGARWTFCAGAVDAEFVAVAKDSVGAVVVAHTDIAAIEFLVACSTGGAR